MFRERTICRDVHPTRLMTLAHLFRMMYWSIRKNPRMLPHLVFVLASWIKNLTVLRLRGRMSSGTLAIGMVEHLGDIVAAEPISRLARRRFPDATIIWATREPYAALPLGFSAVDAVVTVTCLTEWLLLRASGLGAPAWDLHINRRYCPICQIPVTKTGLPGAIFPDNYFQFGNLLAVQCLSVPLPVLTAGPELPIDKDAAKAIASFGLPPRIIVIHCASNDPLKDWPRENWATLLDEILREFDVTVMEVGTRAVAISQDQPRRRNLCGMLSIPQTAEVLRRATLFIGIDSGPAHLANSVAVPGIILMCDYKGFGDYMPFSGRYADRTAATTIRTHGPMSNLQVAPVLHAVQSRLAASTCLRRHNTPTRDIHRSRINAT
jgi:heptosyltransferase III